jgi:hypothetical protein
MNVLQGFISGPVAAKTSIYRVKVTNPSSLFFNLNRLLRRFEYYLHSSLSIRQRARVLRIFAYYQ